MEKMPVTPNNTICITRQLKNKINLCGNWIGMSGSQILSILTNIIKEIYFGVVIFYSQTKNNFKKNRSCDQIPNRFY